MAIIRHSQSTDAQNDYLERLAEEFDNAKRLAEAANSRLESLKKELSAAVDSDGVLDHKGSRWLTAGKYELKRERRVSKSLDQSAIEAWAKENSLWQDISQTVETVVEDKVLTLAFERPDLAPIVQSFFVEKEVWAFKLAKNDSDPT